MPDLLVSVFQNSKPIILRFWAFVGILNFIIGLAGIPGDLETWSKWIDPITRTQTAIFIARRIVILANFINQEWVRVLLITSGILMILWPIRWFWRLRHNLIFLWRTAVENEVWLDASKAAALIAASRWGQSRRRSAAKPKNIFDYNSLISATNPQEREQDRKFKSWCEMALKKFVEETANSKKTIADKTQYNESLLRNWLVERYDDEVISEFGPP